MIDHAHLERPLVVNLGMKLFEHKVVLGLLVIHELLQTVRKRCVLLLDRVPPLLLLVSFLLTALRFVRLRIQAL